MIKYTSIINFKRKGMYSQLKKNSIPFFLLVICSIGIYTRISDIHHNLWLDELTTAWVIEGSFSEIFTRCWINNLSPLYYISIYIPKVFVGYSEFSLRLPSIITGILTIPLIYIITYKLSCSKTLSLLAAFLSSVDSTLVDYSLEVRPYALVIFFSLLHLYIFLFFLQKRQKLFYAVILGLLSGIIILLHYTAVLICIVELFIAIIYFFRKQNFSKQKIYGLLIYVLIPCVILLPFLTHIVYLFENNHILGSFIDKKGLNSIFVLHPHLIRYILFPLMIGFFVEYSTKKNSYTNVNKSFTLFFLLSWYFIPLLIQWFLTKINVATIYYPRYLAWIIPAPIIGSAILIGIFHSKWAKLAFTITLLLLATQFYNKSAILNNLVRKDSQKSMESVLTRNNNRFSWKEAVTKINNSGIEPSKIYVKSSLVESQMLNKTEHVDSLLNNYLLSTVNSMYKLRKVYLEKAEPIHSIAEIPNSMSNYIFVGLIKTNEIEKYLKNGIEISPYHASVKIFYVR